MLKRFAAWIAIAALTAWALVDQLNRYMGVPGGPTFDLSTSNSVAIATFAVAIIMAFAFAFSKARYQRLLLALGLIAMLGPLWLSTRHIYVNDRNAVIERGLFFERSIDGVDPEARCFVERGNFLVAIDKDGRELGRLYEGIFPWSLRESEFFDVLSAGCRHQFSRAR